QPGTIVRGENLNSRFSVTDGNRSVMVAYQGILPDLFREGQGVIAEGALDGSGLFKADTVLAKHDERYMPKEVAEALKKQGHWKDDYGHKTSAPMSKSPRGRQLMIAEVGHYALVLALALALIQSIVPLIGARTNDRVLMGVAEPTAFAQFGFI